MRIVVIGLGSMGRRRARLASQLAPGTAIAGVDLDVERRGQAESELGIETFPSLEEAVSAGYGEAAVVSTSPLTHAGLITECLERGLHVFTELNLVGNGYERNMRIAEERGLVLFLSSTFLYRAEVARIRSEVGGSPSGRYAYHVGQYLPDWHPWEDYRNFFAADARTSGCRELLAIELPWLVDLFGDVVSWHAATRRVSGLDLPYDDTVVALLEHSSGTVGALTVDVACRRAVRNFEYSDATRYLTWDGSPSGLRFLDLASGAMEAVDPYGGERAEQLGDYAAFVVENAYLEELRLFEACVAGKAAPRYGFAEDLRILGLIDSIEGGGR